MIDELKSAAFLASAVLLIVVPSACSSAPSSSSSTTTGSTAETTLSTTVTEPVTTENDSTSVTAAATTTLDSSPPTSATTTTTSTVAGATDACKSSALRLTLGDTEGAMGNQYTPIIFTNTGRTVCTLDGHPGVSFLDAAGRQIGASAERVAGPTPTVTLAPGAQAHATMDYHDPGFFDDCAPMPTTSLRVFPPDETVAITIAFASSICTKPIAQPEVTIDAVRAGTSLP